VNEQFLLDVSEDEKLGKVEIAPEVIEVITGIAASEVAGVLSMRGSFASGITERFGKKSHSKGVKVELTEAGIVTDLYLILKFGVSIPKVCQEIQSNIKQTLKSMTSLEISEVNIHVVGIQMETKESSQDHS